MQLYSTCAFSACWQGRQCAGSMCVLTACVCCSMGADMREATYAMSGGGGGRKSSPGGEPGS